MPSPLFSALKEGFQGIINAVRDVTKAVVSDKAAISAALREQSSAINRMGAGVASALDRIKEPKFTGEVVIDTTALETKVGAATDALEALEIPDVEDIEAALKLIYDSLKEQNGFLRTLPEALFAVAKAVSEKTFVAPDRIKLDDMQLRRLTAARGIQTNPGVLAARNVTVKNVTMTSANTEYSYTFPSNTTSWRIKLRDEGTQFLYTFTTGKMPTSGDGLAYITSAENAAYSQDGVDWSGKTIYLQCGTAGNIAEIISTQA